MGDHSTQQPAPAETYDICLLLERPLSRVDAEQIVALHEDWPDPVHYHLLMPMLDAAARIESALGTLGAGEVMAATPLSVLEDDAERAREEAALLSNQNCAQSVATLEAFGASADAEVVVDDPVDRLAATVDERDSREVIILTRAHLVAEMFHTDWTHQARRRLGVPVLHLLAHRDPHRPPG
jgi:hypothetical protein